MLIMISFYFGLAVSLLLYLRANRHFKQKLNAIYKKTKQKRFKRR
ncbi:hypothetical protein PT276_03495 [Orbaceae bacterium ESL0721]|nr:hypothetical protein [Orbaceae bacterium ESL0721]